MDVYLFNSVKYDLKKYRIGLLIFPNIKITLQFYMKNVRFIYHIVNTAGSLIVINVQNSNCPNTAWFPR